MVTGTGTVRPVTRAETTPEDDPMVAIPGEPLIHVPDEGSVIVVVAPWQILAAPVIGDGNGFTDTTIVGIQTDPVL